VFNGGSINPVWRIARLYASRGPGSHRAVAQVGPVSETVGGRTTDGWRDTTSVTLSSTRCYGR